jgi:hypothetical protein
MDRGVRVTTFQDDLEVLSNSSEESSMKFPIELLFWRSYTIVYSRSNLYSYSPANQIIVIRTYIVYWQGYALLKNRKCEVIYPHFMERSASVANIKCVNRNLLGNL